jgi:hypothetical protein
MRTLILVLALLASGCSITVHECPVEPVPDPEPVEEREGS